MNSFRHDLLVLIILTAGVVACERSTAERVVIRTELGDITLEIETKKAPVTASNFLSLVGQGVYSGAIFYRVVRLDNQPDSPVKIEVIQGGLFDDHLINTFPPIEHETTDRTGILHTDGAISMARNEPGSASTEIFICIGDQPSLDYGGDRNPDGEGFAAFGKVTDGMEVVRKIQELPDSGQYLIKQVVIDSIFLK
jgi:peptidyl-prolyl cis-trans isomerase A (cyclophilin A)